jgi:16S rRNA (adenine1518-N6/adenine1519-N6)-dimethyltransferase
MELDLYQPPINWKMLIHHITNKWQKKSMGQCFLMNYSIVETILNRIVIGNNILEIGPGSGILSHCILSKMAPGGNLTLVEKDSRFIEHLHKLLVPIAQQKNITLNIIEGDALEYVVTKPTEIISNIPYNLSSVLLYGWLKNNINCYSITVMLQKEVAEKLYQPHSCNKNYGTLSVLAQATGKVKKIMDLSPFSFFPAPKVFSQVINYKSYGMLAQEIQELIPIINQAFHNPRKKIINNLTDPLREEVLKSMKIANLRPEEISAEKYRELANKIHEIKKNNQES